MLVQRKRLYITMMVSITGIFFHIFFFFGKFFRLKLNEPTLETDNQMLNP